MATYIFDIHLIDNCLIVPSPRHFNLRSFVAVELTDERHEALLLVLGESLPSGAELELLALVLRRHLGLALVLEAAVEVV